MSPARLPLSGLVVHQWLPRFSPGDAMGAAAVGFRRALRLLGARGDIFATETSLPALVRPMAAFAAVQRSTDVVLYHHGIASPLAGALLHLKCRTGVVFHNITPARLYAGTRLEEPLRAGRAQLAALAGRVDVSLAVSDFNARELVAAGHHDVKVVPLFIEPERFEVGQAEAKLLERLASRGRPSVLTVARVVPHKRIDDLLSLHAELLRISPDATLRIVGGFAKGHRDVQALLARGKELGGVDFAGQVTHAQLVASYRAADVYVSMSEHEGFGVPLIEAMASDLPVLAFGAAAVPETLGGHGLVFDTKHFAALAEVVMLLQRDATVRAKLVDGQRQRAAAFSPEATTQALADALALFVNDAPARRPSKSTSRSRKRVAIVVQRYGEAVVGGAEAHARQVATHLAASNKVEVDVLTTCALHHLTWANELPAGESRDGAVRVHRFEVERARAMRPFNTLSKRLLGRGQDLVTEEEWVTEQGPKSPRLIDAIARAGESHDAIVFFTALYAPAAFGLPLVAQKALMVPTAHDELPMAFQVYDDAFERARALLCNTLEEIEFIKARFPHAARTRVVGVGLEPPRVTADGIDAVRAKFLLREPYLVYVGRLEEGKGVPALIEAHQRMVRQFHDAPVLVLAGGGDLEPRGERIKCIGRVDEKDKWPLLAGAVAAVVPSRFESLSLLALEAFAMGTPVLGNDASAVVAGQIRRSQAGVTYSESNVQTFAEGVQKIGLERALLSKNAKRFAATYTWDKVIDAYLEEFASL